MTPDPKTEALKPEHNPDCLTPEQYGAPEFRLLKLGEPIEVGDELWNPDDKEWQITIWGGRYDVDEDCNTYRRRVAPATDTPDRINQDYAQKRIAELEAGAAAMRDALEVPIWNYNSNGADTIECRACGAEAKIYGNAPFDPPVKPIEHKPDCALASTAGTDFAERLRKAEEGLGIAWADKDAAMIERDELKQQLAAVTKERDEARKEAFDSKITARNRFDDLMSAYEQRDGWKDRAIAAESDRDALAKRIAELESQS